jgi:hypothetical protein
VVSRKYSLKRGLYLRIANKLSEFQMSVLLLATLSANPFAIIPTELGINIFFTREIVAVQTDARRGL